MTRLLVQWLISAVVLLVVARVVPGFHVDGLLGALIAAVVIGLVNATVGLLLKILTFPLTIISFGLFLIIINALMLMLVSRLMTSFHVDGFWPALWGSVLLSLLHWVTKWVVPEG